MKLAVVGDVHGLFDASDVAYFNASDYEALLFVGDLGTYRDGGDLAVARNIAKLSKPAWVIPGNHDAVHLAQLLAETVRRPNAARLWARRQGRRVAALREALGAAQLVGYDHVTLQSGERAYGLIVARPHAMDGGKLTFQPYLHQHFGIDTLEASTERLKTLVRQSPHESLLFLAHNGPSGMGSARDDIWGCDFLPGAGDWGDHDLRAAIDYAPTVGKRVLAVLAGHMHHKLRGGGQRVWTVTRDRIVYVNAARVPRISRSNGRRMHHHVEVRLGGAGIHPIEHWIEAGASEES